MKQLSTTFSTIVFSPIFARISSDSLALAYLWNKNSTGVLDLNGTDTSSVTDGIWE
ncbi:MAG TPA: hypothetical protein VGQ03_09445 [Nitrososphaera sp.]|jgi:hypothetical protein|nr:hypothetical protein [Nitrososphaera sp.]